MANASKNKGKSWEREVAKHLTTIYGVNFQRVPNSGAFVGGFNANRITSLTPEQLLLASGDIILPAFLSHLSLECKFYKDFSFETLLTENPTLDKWIEQAEAGNKIPFVLFKINRKGGFIVMPSTTATGIGLRHGLNYLAYNRKTKDGYKRYIVVKFEGFFEEYKEPIVALSPENYKIYVNATPQNSTESSGNRLQQSS